MKTKILLIASIAIFSILKISAQISQPVTAVSFPKEIIPADAGRIEFYAKLNGYSGSIPVATGPYFFLNSDNATGYRMGFNSNDGMACGGLTGFVGNGYACGTGFFGSWDFEDVYEAGAVEQWHFYEFVWDKDGFPQGNNTRKVEIYIDGVLSSSHWEKSNSTLLQPTDGTFNLITFGNISNFPGEIAIDELKIYDGAGNLVLHNKLGSQQEIENSVAGLNGSFNGFGNAHFIPGIDGFAVEAKPIWSFGDVSSCNIPKGLNTTNITSTSVMLGWDDVPEALGYKIQYKIAGTSEWAKTTASKSNSKPISGLSPGTSYDCRIKSICSTDPKVVSGWSAIQTFTTGVLRTVDGSLQQVSFQIYPNPAVDRFVMDIKLNSLTDEPVEVYLLNALGQVICTEKAIVENGELKKEITMPSAASSGMYILRVVLSDQVMEQKLLFEK